MIDFSVKSPTTIEELLKEIEAHQDGCFRFGAGYSDLLMEFKKQNSSPVTVINLTNIKEPFLTTISEHPDSIRIGALVTASEIVSNAKIQELFPVLHKAAETLASKQIRNVATIGGNICTASPAGDISTALVALDAVCEILSSDNKIREVPIREFFKGVRKTDLNKNEVLRSIRIPFVREYKTIKSDYIKIGVRKSMECSIVSLAYQIYLNENGKILNSGVAIGSSAPVIMFTKSACDFLKDKNLNEINETAMEEFAKKIVEYASPISDIRGSEWYRRQVLYNISRSIFEAE